MIPGFFGSGLAVRFSLMGVFDGSGVRLSIFVGFGVRLSFGSLLAGWVLRECVYLHTHTLPPRCTRTPRRPR